MTSDGRFLPKFLSPMPISYEAPTVPANRLFPKRSYRKVPKDKPSLSTTKDKLPALNKMHRHKTDLRNTPSKQHPAYPGVRVPVPPTQQDNTHKNSPAIQRQKRAQKLRDIRTNPTEHVAIQPQANMDKQYATAINDSLKLDVEEKTALDGPLLQSWDEDKVFDHPMHRLLSERIDRLYREEKMNPGFFGKKTKTSPHHHPSDRYHQLGIALRSKNSSHYELYR